MRYPPRGSRLDDQFFHKNPLNELTIQSSHFEISSIASRLGRSFFPMISGHCRGVKRTAKVEKVSSGWRRQEHLKTSPCRHACRLTTFHPCNSLIHKCVIFRKHNCDQLSQHINTVVVKCGKYHCGLKPPACKLKSFRSLSRCPNFAHNLSLPRGEPYLDSDRGKS